MHIGEAESAALIFVGQRGVVDAHLVEDRGLEVVDVHGAFVIVVFVGIDHIAIGVGEIVAIFIGVAVHVAALDAAARDPC